MDERENPELNENEAPFNSLELVRKDSVAKENEKFDGLERSESNFLSQLKKTTKAEEATTQKSTLEGKMKLLVEQAEKYASFLLSKHRGTAPNSKSSQGLGALKIKRRKSGNVVKEDEELLR